MRGKGLIITLIVLLSIIAIGLTTFLVLCLNGTIDLKNFKFSFGSRKSDNLLYNETYELEKVKDIEILQDAGDIIFENSEGTNIRVEVYGDYKEDVELSLTADKLKVNYKSKNRGFFNNVYGDIKIFIPSNFAGNIKIDDDAGEIKIADLENVDLNVDCDAGNVKIGKIKSIKADCDAGNVKIGCVTSYCDIKLDCGNLEIENMTLDRDSYIKADMGNVRINGIKNVYVDGHVSLGKCNLENNDRNAKATLKINCDLGNIDVK